MKVLQINSVCGIGSTGRIATDIHNILIEQGYESYIAYGRDLSKNCTSVIKIGTEIDNYTHVAKTRIFDKHGFGSKRATEDFIIKVKELDPDIIHLHNIHGYYINVEILFDYLKEANKPVVWTLHDCWSFTGHCSHFDYIGCEKWKSGCYKCPQKKQYPKSILHDNSRHNYSRKESLFSQLKNLTLVTPSKWLSDKVKESFLKDYRVEVITNGIDLSLFQRKGKRFRYEYEIKDKFLLLGVANNWTDKKGYGDFIQLSKVLSNEYLIVMVGLNKGQLSCIPRNILGIERTDSIEELVDIYSSSDVYINFTREEVLGLTNIEAQACGTPVITYNSGGSPETIDGSTGRIIEIDEYLEVIPIIEKMKSRSISFDRSKIEEVIRSKYSSIEMSRKYLHLYREVIGRK